jgi:hypothetical protein
MYKRVRVLKVHLSAWACNVSVEWKLSSPGLGPHQVVEATGMALEFEYSAIEGADDRVSAVPTTFFSTRKVNDFKLFWTANEVRIWTLDDILKGSAWYENLEKVFLASTFGQHIVTLATAPTSSSSHWYPRGVRDYVRAIIWTIHRKYQQIW